MPGAQVLRTAESWIQKTPDVCGGEACIRQTRHTVWGVVEWQKLGLSDPQILARHPDLKQTDLDAAWAYYRQNPDEIEHALKLNDNLAEAHLNLGYTYHRQGRESLARPEYQRACELKQDFCNVTNSGGKGD